MRFKGLTKCVSWVTDKPLYLAKWRKSWAVPQKGHRLKAQDSENWPAKSESITVHREQEYPLIFHLASYIFWTDFSGKSSKHVATRKWVLCESSDSSHLKLTTSKSSIFHKLRKFDQEIRAWQKSSTFVIDAINIKISFQTSKNGTNGDLHNNPHTSSWKFTVPINRLREAD